MLGFRPTEARLTPLHYFADSAFPLGDPNPVKADVIADGLSVLRGGDFHLGMFFDGDADRMDVYMGDGTLLASSFVYAAILPVVLRRMRSERYADLSPIPHRSGHGAHTKPIVYADTKSCPTAIREMAAAGAEVQLIRSGHSHIKHTMGQVPEAVGTVEESAHFYEAFVHEGRRHCTENTLYFALMVARVWDTMPERFRRMAELQARTGREREWGHIFPSDAARADALTAVRDHFASSGAEALDCAADGTPLGADLIRSPQGGPVNDGAEWLQISQRASQSEDGLARWEVMASSQESAADAKREVERIVKGHGAGPEYQG
jgi:phosphomannomutase